jgi:citrate lyase subunit beta/citryl-CoA lyase
MRMISKAPAVDADAIILDLEDAVSSQDKETARFLVKDSLEFAKSGGAFVIVRVNGITTTLLADDLNSVVKKGLDAIMLPKCGSKDDVHKLEGLLKRIERKRHIRAGSIKILPTLETAKGVQNAYEIATASKRVFAIGFGAGDYTVDMGGSPYRLNISKDETEILYPRAVTAVAARSAGIKAIDTVFFGILTDREGFAEECRLAQRLGFHGKFLIHPNQILAANEIFSPSAKDIEYAQRVKEAFREAKGKGAIGAATLDGRLIDYATYHLAEDVLAFAEAVGDRAKLRRSQALLPAIPI